MNGYSNACTWNLDTGNHNYMIHSTSTASLTIHMLPEMAIARKGLQETRTS